MLGQPFKYLVLCLLIAAFGCSSRIEYVYLSADKDAPAVNAMVAEYCSSGNEIAKKLVADNWGSDQLKVIYCGTTRSGADVKLMVFIRAMSGEWPGINSPLIALVKGGKIISSYYESSSDILNRSIFDYDNNQLRVYLYLRSGGTRVMDFAITDNALSVVKTEIVGSR